MNSQNFVFPPPPPPPPTPVGPQSYPNYAQPLYQQGFNQQASYNGGYRGRGRGGNFRGSRGGSTYNGQPPRNNIYPAANNAYNPQSNGYPNGDYPLPNYPTVQQPQYPVQGGYGYGTASMHGSAPHSNGLHANGFNPPNYPNGQATYDPRHSSQQQYQPQATPPIVMGPPIRMGFNGEQPNRYEQAPVPQPNPYSHAEQLRMVSFLPPENHVNGHHRQNSPGDIRPTRHYSPNPFPTHRGRGQKRMHSDAFGASRGAVKRAPASPAVPSFGNALPVKPPLPQENGKKPRKKKRKHNQLGLTPKAEEHESSEEEDVDEESKLAAQASIKEGPKEELQFWCKGQLATLKSPSDIAAWIEERKKRFPTKARAEEAAKQKLKTIEEVRAAKLLHKETLQKKKEAIEQERRDLDEEAKIKLKAEKLRKQYEKAQRRVAEMEAKKFSGGHTTIKKEVPSSPQMKRLSGSQSNEGERATVGNNHAHDQKDDTGPPEISASLKVNVVATSDKDTAEDIAIIRSTNITPGGKPSETLITTTDPLTPTSQPISPDIPISSSLRNLTASPHLQPPGSRPLSPLGIELNASLSDSDSSSSISTSSSSASDSDSSSDSDSPPTETPSNHQKPSNVIAPKVLTKKKKAICKHFLANGRCPMGEKCRYRHELPERGARKRDAANKWKEEGRKERVSLYQRMVKQEQDAEHELALQHSVFLGEKGPLDDGEDGGGMRAVKEVAEEGKVEESIVTDLA